jgi:hypothetical protein
MNLNYATGTDILPLIKQKEGRYTLAEVAVPFSLLLGMFFLLI